VYKQLIFLILEEKKKFIYFFINFIFLRVYFLLLFRFIAIFIFFLSYKYETTQNKNLEQKKNEKKRNEMTKYCYKFILFRCLFLVE